MPDLWEEKYWRLWDICDELDHRLSRIQALVNDVRDDEVPVVQVDDLKKALDGAF